MTSADIREKFLKFFESKGHAIVPSSLLVPENDPTTLFTGSGMQPMLPYLLGESHPLGTRIVDSQKCFRSGDIEEVGDNRHTTFFEMLGNWSLGDYFKKEQLSWLFEFLTNEIHIDPSRLYVTVFIGDETYGFPKDTESVDIWKGLFKEKGIEALDVEIGSEQDGYEKGMQGGRIFYYDAGKNWWSRAGVPQKMPVGEPGGPDSEIFYDFGTPHDPKFGKECHPNCDCGRFLEIGNSVFMEYLKESENKFVPLKDKNVDFGGGLERLSMAANNTPDIIRVNHDAIVKYVEEVSGKVYGEDLEDTKAFRIIADHMKAAVFLIADGIRPANADQGYFVRRLIRRSVVYADKLGVAESKLAEVVEPIADMYATAYPDVRNKLSGIKAAIAEEESRFRETLAKGLKQFEKNVDPFVLFTTYGFPLELTKEIAKNKGIEVDEEKFKKDMEAHQELSRAGSEQKFKGGLGDTSEMSVKYHTATHLLHQALHDVLGDEVGQKGSNITPERLRFDFSFPRKLTDEERARVEEIVNQKISENLPMQNVVLPKSEAEKVGARHFFDQKYPDEVSVYYIGNDLDGAYSKEFCGGPHVTNTGVLGKFKITKEEAVSAGVRRVKAILE